MGGYEPNPKPWTIDRLSDNFEFQLLEDDLEHFEPLLELAAGRVPAMQTAGIKQFINGPERVIYLKWPDVCIGAMR
jgi:4-methylaminobutanoate oxidase (formaldehyde-forming)